MAASVSYRINGKYDGKAISQAKQGMSQLADTAKSLKGALGALGAVAGVKVLVSQFKEATKTFKENNKVQTQMFQALSNNAKTAKSNIKELVKEFDSMSGIFGGSDIVKGGTLLARMGLDEDQMRKTTQAAKDLAASGVMTLDQAFESLGKSYSGNITSLKKLFPELQNLTKEELEAGKAVEILGNKFKGMESAFGGTFEGQITILRDKIDGIKNTIGTMGGFFMENAFGDLSNVLDSLTNVTKNVMPSMAAWAVTIAHAFTNIDLSNIFSLTPIKNYFKALFDTFKMTWNKIKAFAEGNKSNTAYAASVAAEAQIREDMRKAANSENRDLLPLLRQQLKLQQEQTKILKEQADVENMTWEDLWKGISDGFKDVGSELIKSNLSVIAGEDMAAFYESMLQKYSTYIDNNFTGGAGNGGTTSGTGVTSGTGSGGIYSFSLEDLKKNIEEMAKSFGDIGTIITAALEDSWFGVIISMIGSAVKVIGEKTTILTELFSLFDNIFRSIFTPEFISMLNNFFGPIMEVIKSLGQSVGYILSIISEVFGPVLMAIGKCAEIIAKVIQSVLAVCYNIYVAVWNAFHTAKNEKEYKSIGDIWSNINNTDYSQYSAGLSNTSVGGTAASYNAARDVIVNISFNNSYVNGDAREIAVSLYNEFRAAERMGYIS